jgi:hypothetical protein
MILYYKNIKRLQKNMTSLNGLRNWPDTDDMGKSLMEYSNQLFQINSISFKEKAEKILNKIAKK